MPKFVGPTLSIRGTCLDCVHSEAERDSYHDWSYACSFWSKEAPRQIGCVSTTPPWCPVLPLGLFETVSKHNESLRMQRTEEQIREDEEWLNQEGFYESQP